MTYKHNDKIDQFANDFFIVGIIVTFGLAILLFVAQFMYEPVSVPTTPEPSSIVEPKVPTEEVSEMNLESTSLATLPTPPIVKKFKTIRHTTTDERLCVRQALFHEARGEGKHGLDAVASVIINRVKSLSYPNTFCGVINQNKQFSYTHELADPRINVDKLTDGDKAAFLLIDEMSHDIISGKFKPIFGSNVKWYHTKAVSPHWSTKMNLVATVGDHKFFSNRQ